jgi:3-deoxy-D-manno-octulosonic-acid transferase
MDLIYIPTFIAVTPILLYRLIRQNRYRVGLKNRFGSIPAKNPHKKCIWIHAVSVGEVNASRTIIDSLLKQAPGCQIALSTTTDTGYARANSLYADKLNIFFFPLDFSPIMARAFKNLAPSLCLLIELEVWPNFVDIAKKNNIPVVVVNGRLSDRSFTRYKKVKPLVSPIFKKLTRVFAQTQTYADRFIALGTNPENVTVTGSLKYDTAQLTDKVEGADILKTQLALTSQRLIVAGATGPEEEAIILNAYTNLKKDPAFTDTILAIVPRKPERFDAVAKLITDNNFDLIRYNPLKQQGGTASLTQNSVILGDTMGDLRKFYSLASVVFVGRSLVPMGGSDMIEAAALAKPTTFGPHTYNFTQPANALLNANAAALVNSKEELLAAWKKILTDPQYATSLAQNAQNVIRANQGATQKTVAAVIDLL